MVDVEGCCASSVSPFCFIYIYTFKCFIDWYSITERGNTMSYFSAYLKVLKVNTFILGVLVTIVGIVFAVDKAKEELSR